MESINSTDYFVPDSITLDRTRELLGDESTGLSDEELDRIRGDAELLAQVIIELYTRQRPTIH